MPYFEKVSRFKDLALALPTRSTKNSAGYDLYVAEETVVPPYISQLHSMRVKESGADMFKMRTLEEMKNFTAETGNRPTLVSTGMKIKLDDNQYLELSPRSSTPLKYWLVMANSEGIIDADYYNNPQNEGEIFLQMINLSPFPIKLKVGDCIGQGIIKTYGKVDDDQSIQERVGGFGSTTLS